MQFNELDGFAPIVIYHQQLLASICSLREMNAVGADMLGGRAAGVTPIAIFGKFQGQLAELRARHIQNTQARYMLATHAGGDTHEQIMTVGGELHIFRWRAGTQRLVSVPLSACGEGFRSAVGRHQKPKTN